MVDLERIREAAARLKGVARRTPLLESLTWSALAGGPVFLKAENLQRTGSFKIRGASNLISLLEPVQKARGVIAASAGNHAQGVAVAASAAGIRSLVVMPETASFAKVAATRGYGAEVVQEGADFPAAMAAMQRLGKARGMVVVPTLDDERIIAGQGTLGLEIIEQLPDVELVLVPVGGGGLAAGVATAIKALAPSVAVVGVQAAASDSAARLFHDSPPVRPRPTIADGIAVGKPGEITVPILRRLLDDVVVVDEETITAAMVRLLEYSKLVVEGAGAVGAAALLSGAVAANGRKTVVILSGGNVDVNLMARVVEHGLGESGRYASVTVTVPDRPGRLASVVQVLGAAGANILDVQHRRAGPRIEFGTVEIEFLVETRNSSHAQALFEALREAGFREDGSPTTRGRRFHSDA